MSVQASSMADTDSQKRIPLCEPLLAGNEAAYLQDCVETNWISSAGSYVDDFEKQFVDYIEAKHAVAVVNGTAALHLALVVAGVRPDDEVLVSALSFVAPANAIRHAGARPVFVDSDEATWQMDPDVVVSFLRQDCDKRDGGVYNKRTGRRIGAILPVHILGLPVEMGPVVDIATELGIPVVEDATESLGAVSGGEKVGNLGDIACFSFNGNKLVTCGGGGMIVTNNGDWARHARHLSTQARMDGDEYIHDEVGFNYRLTNLQAAVGVAQMEEINSLLEAKSRIASRYRDMCDALPGMSFMPTGHGDPPAWWLSTVRMDANATGCHSRELRAFLQEQGIETRPLWRPLHQGPAHSGEGFLGGITADLLYDECLCLPSSVGLKDDDVNRVISLIKVRVGG